MDAQDNGAVPKEFRWEHGARRLGNSCPRREDDSRALGDDTSWNGTRTQLGAESQTLQDIHICNMIKNRFNLLTYFKCAIKQI